MASDGVETRQQETASAFAFKKSIEDNKSATLAEIAKIYPGVNAKWMQTFEAQTEVLKGWLGTGKKGYNYSRNKGIMPFLESIAKTYCGVEGGSRIFATKDTWNPMDIVMVKRSQEASIRKFIKEIITIEGLTEKGRLGLLNSVMYESLKQRVMIPISLKKIKLSVGVDIEEELNTGNPETKDWFVPSSPKCNLDIKNRTFETSEFSMFFQLEKPPRFKIKLQVRNRQLSNPNGTVQLECINDSKPAAKLGTVPADLIEKSLESAGLSKPDSISKNNNIPNKFPGDWSEDQLKYWINLYEDIKNNNIGGKSVDFGSLKITGQGQDESGIESIIRNGALNETIVERKDNGRFRNLLVSMEYVKVFQQMDEKGKLNDLLNVLYYGSKKAFDPLNGSFVKIY
tara:strand:- start:127 stop:1323 length:1197 start_codon:yes stop_codon:yes gene_type:complete